MNNRQCKAFSLLVALAAALLMPPAIAAEVPDQLPDPDGNSPDMSKPVQVCILMGQSNMLGFGRIEPEDQRGTLSRLVKRKKKCPHLIDDAGNWTERKDVRKVHVMNVRGAGLTELTKFQDVEDEWLTVSGRHIGPELQFGHIMGHIHVGPVPILKACIGNRSLGWDLLPPGSGRWRNC